MSTLGFMMFDPMYWVYVGPAILLALFAQMWVKSAFARAKEIGIRSGLSGAETAQRILNAYGIDDVRIEPVRGFLGDHYSPNEKALRLSPDVYNGRSAAAVGVAAHEVGHAIQHAKGYAPLVLRNAIVPIASLGSNLAFFLVIGGMFLHMMGLSVAGLILFGAVVVFQLVNLPVEFNASSRARKILVTEGIVTQEEDREVGKVLNAAAMTYVAATVTAILQMLYFASIVFGGSRD